MRKAKPVRLRADGCIETHDTSTLETTADEKKDDCPGMVVVVEKEGGNEVTLERTEGLSSSHGCGTAVVTRSSSRCVGYRRSVA